VLVTLGTNAGWSRGVLRGFTHFANERVGTNAKPNRQTPARPDPMGRAGVTATRLCTTGNPA
jgi:hypothetical protein